VNSFTTETSNKYLPTEFDSKPEWATWILYRPNKKKGKKKILCRLMLEQPNGFSSTEAKLCEDL
jgi:hypothetical protein